MPPHVVGGGLPPPLRGRIMNTIVANIIPGNAELIPDHPAIIDQGRKYTFLQHANRVLQLVGALKQAGCHRGDRIGILSRNCAEYLEIYGACELAGFIAAPVNYRLTASEINYIVDNTTPSVLFHGAEFLPVVDEIRTAGTLYVQIDQGSLPERAVSYEGFIKDGEIDAPGTLPSPGDPVYIVHTSGTTGNPKGAVLSQSAQYGTAQVISDAAEITRADRFLLVQPLFHVGAKFLQLAHHLQGATIYMQREFNPLVVWDTLQTERITTLQLVPTMIEMLLADEYAETRDPARIKTIFYSTAPIREILLRKALDVFGPVFIQQYGSTEGSSISNLTKSQHQPDGTAAQQRRLLSAGQACDGVEIKIVKSDGTVAGTGEPGEIVVRHPDIMQEYWNDPAATAESINDGWLNMGDIGYLDEQGFLFIVDRKRDMIISGGENIYPREVEIALEQHPVVKQCAVIGIPDERWGEAVCAFVVPSGEATESDLIEHCRTLIASYKKPKKINFVEELPRLATGKVDKVRLRAPYWQGRQTKII